ncbi:chymotrypsin-1-like [Drosophila persimilis]|uniref:chymotrypsin-1-like n=1 Tax=Drosophila persimilis TaxID=7234 RepID=UPI000F086075|nr:chymotrypsin-1-like [Drosophila persimilis]
MPWTGRLSLIYLLLLGSSLDVTFSKRLDRKVSDNRIVGGHEAEEGAAPYQVSIQTVWKTHICGGVILDKEWILTAGHCALDYGINDIRIVVGTNNRSEPGQMLYPDEALVHCLYDVPYIYNNDIGLIHVNESIIMNDRTQMVKLSSVQPWPQARDATGGRQNPIFVDDDAAADMIAVDILQSHNPGPASRRGCCAPGHTSLRPTPRQGRQGRIHITCSMSIDPSYTRKLFPPQTQGSSCLKGQKNQTE